MGISKRDDLISVEDITDRVEELRDEREDFEHDDDGNRTASEWASAYDDEATELAELEALLDDLRGNGGDHQWEGDWYPQTLIRDGYFEEAMDDLLEDIGDLPKDLPCYLRVVVDYDALRMDYTSAEFRGETFWFR